MNSITQIIEEIDKTNEKYKSLVALNQRQTADILGVSPSTLEAWRRENVGPGYKKIDNGKKGRILYTKHAIAEWLSNSTTKA